MQKAGHITPLPGGQFNTLAQTGTTNIGSGGGKNPIVVHGTGSDKCDTTSLKSKAKRKVITQNVCLALIDVAREKGDFDMIKAYWNTYHCQQTLICTNDRLHGVYCRNSFCTICAGIRKAEIINHYLPVLMTWDDAYFVTLTARSVTAPKLRSRFQRMIKSLNKILARNKKRFQRGKAIQFMGIRSLECNFNPIARTYNPHFHIIVSSREAAELLIKEWLEQCTPKFALRQCQYMRKVKDQVHDLIEVVKYGSKIFTDPTMNKKDKGKIPPKIYVAAFHNIIKSMRGLRLFERFGFNVCSGSKAPKSTLVTDYDRLVFSPELFDWIDPESAELLSGYKPNPELLVILRGNMDLELH